MQDADLADSGKYSCAPSNANVSSIRVHVLNGMYVLKLKHLIDFFIFLNLKAYL